MPEQLIRKIKKGFSPRLMVCFYSSLVVGLICHLYKITNWIPNWDSIVFRYDSQNMLALGRWFLPIVCAPSSFYDLPFVTGLMAILFYSLGAVCIVKMFDIKKEITAGLIGAFVVTFPVSTSVMLYNYVADGYALAFMLSCLAAMMLVKNKPSYILSVLFIALSAGIYQAYISVTIMLLLLYIILEILKKNSDLKRIMIKTVKFLFAGTFGMVLYYIILVILLKITGTELLEYQGFNSTVALSGFDLFASLYTIKYSFLDFFFGFSKGIALFNVLNIIVFALIFVFYLADVIKNKLNFAKIITLVVFVALLPIGASVLSLLNSEIDYHNLIKMGFVVFYLFLIFQYERADFKSTKLNLLKLWSIFILSVILIFNQIIIANVSYHKLNMAYEKSMGMLIRIADRIEQTEDAFKCDRILVQGHLPGSEDYSVILPPDMTGVTDGYILRADDEIVGQSVMCSALNDYCGKNYSFLAGKEKESFLKKTKVQNLKCWPDKESVAVIDNVIIIKLSDER